MKQEENQKIKSGYIIGERKCLKTLSEYLDRRCKCQIVIEQWVALTICWAGVWILTVLKPVHTVADFGRKRRLSPFSRRFRRQSPFSPTVAVFGDSVDRALVCQSSRDKYAFSRYCYTIMIGYWHHNVVCPSVCLSVYNLCIVVAFKVGIVSVAKSAVRRSVLQLYYVSYAVRSAVIAIATLLLK